ncbi:MAG: M42 family metallopeptidase [Ruminococcaceae bacterium]|nr:M42 family metallopeptidase [Oscillospiraceae bacterium]
METLRKLTACGGGSGDESNIRKLIAEEVEPYADEVYTDALGSLIVHKRGMGKKIMLAAHMDEIGLMATFMDENGFIRFAPVGGVDAFSTLHQRVRFSNGTIGVVGYEESMTEMKELKLSRMYIDIGAPSREAAEKAVHIGDIAVFEGELRQAGNRVVSKALDNRIGVYVLIDVLRQISAIPYDLYFVFTSQEEVGLRGARGAAFDISPDFGIAVDVTDTGDTPECPKMAVKLGGGAAIKVKDGSVIASPIVRSALEKTARKNGIPYQSEILERGGTDAGAIHLTRGGVPTGAVSVPCRYIHTPCEMVDIDDVNAVIKLLLAFLQKEYL